MRRQRQFPMLPDQIPAKAVMRLLAHEMKTGGLVNAAPRAQHVVCPQCTLAIPRRAGKADTLPDEPASDAKPASLWLDIKQSQFGDFFAVPDEEYRADDFAITLGNPAALPPGIEILDKTRGDPRDQCLESRPEAIFRGIEDAVAVDDPADVARLVRAEDVGEFGLFASHAEQAFNPLQRGNQLRLVGSRQRAQKRGDLVARPRVYRREHLAAAVGQGKDDLSAIALRRMLGDDTLGREALQHAAQVTRIQTEPLRQFGCCGVLALRKLVKDPTFGQRQRTAEQPFL